MRPSVNLPVPCRGWTFEFETSGPFVSHLTVEVPLTSRDEWPKVHRNPTPGVKAHIETREPHYKAIRSQLRTLQGLLGLFGLQSIDLDTPEVEWIPDSDEERESLPLFSFQSEPGSLPDDAIGPVSFDLLARSIIAAESAAEIEVPLNFFRRGIRDMQARDYIEAIYDFYFVLETVFAGGKFRSNAVLQEFQKSATIRRCVDGALKSPDTFPGQSFQPCRSEYANLSVDQALDRLVKLRGRLHHHTSKRRDSWHPDEQRTFKCDAVFLQAVTFAVAFELAERYLWDKEVIRAYEQLVPPQQDAGGPP